MVRIKKLPKKLREWSAYDEINVKVSDLQVLLPLLTGLSKPSIKPRHWIEINNLLLQSPLPVPHATTNTAQANSGTGNAGIASFSSTRQSMYGNVLMPLPFMDEEFKLSHILNSNIIHFKEEIEEICDGADKQLQIEKRLYEVNLFPYLRF